MKLDPKFLFIAVASTFALAWIICAAFVVMMPNGMMALMGHMVHANLEDMQWTMTATGFFVGLVAWSLLAGVFVWFIASVYNKLER